MRWKIKRYFLLFNSYVTLQIKQTEMHSIMRRPKRYIRTMVRKEKNGKKRGKKKRAQSLMMHSHREICICKTLLSAGHNDQDFIMAKIFSLFRIMIHDRDIFCLLCNDRLDRAHYFRLYPYLYSQLPCIHFQLIIYDRQKTTVSTSISVYLSSSRRY